MLLSDVFNLQKVTFSRNTAILDIIPVIYCKLVSKATVFVTSHNTTPHEREGKGEERCVTRQKRGNGRLLISWILIIQLWTHERQQQLSCMVRQYVNQNFEFRLFFIIWILRIFFCHVAQIQVLLTTSHFQIPVIIDSRTHKPFETSF